MVIILMMLAKIATLGLLQIKVFLNKGYAAVILAHEITNKILLNDSNCIAFLRGGLGSSSII